MEDDWPVVLANVTEDGRQISGFHECTGYIFGLDCSLVLEYSAIEQRVRMVVSHTVCLLYPQPRLVAQWVIGTSLMLSPGFGREWKCARSMSISCPNQATGMHGVVPASGVALQRAEDHH